MEERKNNLDFNHKSTPSLRKEYEGIRKVVADHRALPVESDKRLTPEEVDDFREQASAIEDVFKYRGDDFVPIVWDLDFNHKSTLSLHKEYEAIRMAVEHDRAGTSEDDEFYGAEVFDDFRKQADAIEAVFKNRNEPFVPIDWEDRR